MNRAGYAALKNAMLRRDDTLVVKSLDRLSRNKCDIKNELQYFKDNGIRLKVIDLPTTMMDLPEGQEWVFEMVNCDIPKEQQSDLWVSVELEKP